MSSDPRGSTPIPSSPHARHVANTLGTSLATTWSHKSGIRGALGVPKSKDSAFTSLKHYGDYYRNFSAHTHTDMSKVSRIHMYIIYISI